jgi:pimeloyl-ACP methyl ester carboxylesterase
MHDQSRAKTSPDIRVNSVSSRDGTTIRYHQLGRGPGVVLLHGAMESAESHLGLAKGLADAWTVYLPERRGHTLGLPFVASYRMQDEVDDLDALLTKTGASSVFGVSAGGLVCLAAALSLSRIQRMALYEPALIVNGSASTALLSRYDSEIRQGRLAAALVTGMLAAQLGPAVFNRMPRWLLEWLTKTAMRTEERKAQPGAVTMRALAPTLHYDFRLIAEMAETLEQFATVRARVLLLGGRQSPAWFKTALASLATVLPRAERIELPGLGHGGSSDVSATNRNGDPARVAEALRRFFTPRRTDSSRGYRNQCRVSS